MNFKCVVAIKTKTNCKCNIKINEISKSLDLPSQEAQFFDISQIPDHILFEFENIAVLTIPVPKEQTDEIELTDSFQLKDLKGKYYILFLLSKDIKFETNQSHQSPLRHYLKSYKTRTKERQQKVKTQQLINQQPNSIKQQNQNELLKQQYETVKEENKLLKMRERNDYLNELEISQAKRKQLQQFISQLSEDLTNQNETLQEKHIRLSNELIELQQKFDDLQSLSIEQQLKIEQMHEIIQDKQASIQHLQQNIENQDQNKQMLQLYAKQKKDLEQVLQQVSSQYEKDLLDKQQQIQRLKNEEVNLLKEKEQKLEQENEMLKQKIQSQEEQLEGLNNYINQQKVKLSLVEQKNCQNQIFEQLNNQLEKDIINKDKQIYKLQDDIALLQRQIGFQQFHQNDELEKEIRQLKEQIAKQLLQINSLDTENTKLRTENLKIAVLQQNLQTLKIQYTIPDFPDLKPLNSKVTQFQSQIENQMKELNNLRQTIFDLNKKHDEKELHNSQLKTMMTQIVESNQAYIPAKGDDLDQQIANFINNRVDKEKYIPLLKRQSDGVYLYGHKRIFIKQEQGKILIRSGGGYLNIEEFLGLNESKMKDLTTDVIKRQAIQKKTERMKTIT
ncbi:unnamed protein product [Paramecium primaurelia]|uniref:GAR domain-containing protein n=1 Tax=Paramecium primaurelia TaxID=5886 RepID=A0A8S1QB37_PARPR|nr:unnamed protein product [Paramecium primaurelia]